MNRFKPGASYCAVILCVAFAALGAEQKVLRLPLDVDVVTLDPIQVTDTISDGVCGKIYNKLVRFELQNGTLVVKPDLAESFSVSADGTQYTFKLRKGVRFHNGREFTAADVVYSLKRVLSEDSKRPDLLRPLIAGSSGRLAKAELGLKAVDATSVAITLEQPFAPFLMHLAQSNCAIVPREAVENRGTPFDRNPVGTGPFKFAEWKAGESLRLVRFDEYFRGKPKLDALQYTVLRREEQLTAFAAGTLDAASIPLGQTKVALETHKEHVLKNSVLRTNYIGIGMPRGEFANKADLKPLGTNKLIRQAMNCALDREHLAQTVMEGRAIPATGILPPGMPGHRADRSAPKDLDKARKLLEQAGYPGGKGLPAIPLLVRDDTESISVAESVVTDLAKIGITVELQKKGWSDMLRAVESEPQPMFSLAWVADYPDPDNFLYVLFNSENTGMEGNSTWYKNAEVDALTSKARVTKDWSERVKMYQRAEELILEDSPWLCTVHGLNTVLLHKRVKGIREHVTALDTSTDFPQVDFSGVDLE